MDENKIEQAIKLLTGLDPVEEISIYKYSLKLGTRNPLEIGYDKTRHLLTEGNMRYSALCKMLNVISELIIKGFDFRELT